MAQSDGWGLGGVGVCPGRGRPGEALVGSGTKNFIAKIVSFHEHPSHLSGYTVSANKLGVRPAWWHSG